MTRAFRFRLDRLLALRRRKRDLAERKLVRARGQVSAQERRIRELLDEEAAAADSLRGLSVSALDLGELRLHEGYRDLLRNRRVREGELLAKRVKAEEECRRELLEALKEVQVLERLRERRQRAWRVEFDRREREAFDEAARNAPTRA